MQKDDIDLAIDAYKACLLYTSPSPRDRTRSRMPSSACKKKHIQLYVNDYTPDTIAAIPHCDKKTQDDHSQSNNRHH